MEEQHRRTEAPVPSCIRFPYPWECCPESCPVLHVKAVYGTVLVRRAVLLFAVVPAVLDVVV